MFEDNESSEKGPELGDDTIISRSSPAACLFPHGHCSWLLPQHSPSQRGPTTSCCTAGLGLGKFPSTVHELHLERGPLLCFTSQPFEDV